MRTVLRSRRIVTEQGIVDGVIEIEDGKIVRIGPAAGPADLDFEDQRIIPGIIDIHNHGFGGWSMTDPAKEKDVKGFAKAVASVGVTGVLPTAKEEAFEAIADCTGQPLDGARIYGVHSEGPFWARGGENTVGEDYPLPDVAGSPALDRQGQRQDGHDGDRAGAAEGLRRHPAASSKGNSGRVRAHESLCRGYPQSDGRGRPGYRHAPGQRDARHSSPQRRGVGPVFVGRQSALRTDHRPESCLQGNDPDLPADAVGREVLPDFGFQLYRWSADRTLHAL